jgi:hypothetical protein
MVGVDGFERVGCPPGSFVRQEQIMAMTNLTGQGSYDMDTSWSAGSKTMSGIERIQGNDDKE